MEEITIANVPDSVPTIPRGLLPAISVMVSPAERDHVDMLRARSLELAYQRGHLRRS